MKEIGSSTLKQSKVLQYFVFSIVPTITKYLVIMRNDYADKRK